jgi:glutamyl-Q tRNA(Asp) synthetase
MIVTRFAPSPTGHLHLGHAYSAFYAFDASRRANGQFLLRIEDIDPVRCKPGLAEDMLEDLRWLGFAWPEPVRRQSQHFADYISALDRLRERRLVYRCFCTRSDIAVSAAAPHLARNVEGQGPDGPIYAGTCRQLSSENIIARKAAWQAYCWRLDVAKAVAQTGALAWHDRQRGEQIARPEIFGDVVLARKDVPTSYHLSVTVDDHLQGVNLVTRGEDLFAATHIHRLLQALLGYVTPDYDHHALLSDASGRRFAKRDQSVTLRILRGEGKTPADIFALIGLTSRD